MAVRSVTEIPDSWEGDVNDSRQRTYRRAFRVEVTDRRDGPRVVRTAVDPVTSLAIPSIGDYYYVSADEQDDGTYCSKISARHESMFLDHDGTLRKGHSFLVTAEYSPSSLAQMPESPIDWKIRFRWDSQKYERPAIKDVLTDEPILNSASEPFAEPVMRDDSRSLLVITRNERVDAFDNDWAQEFRDHINDDAWNGYAQYTVKCASITTGESQWYSDPNGGGFWYFQVTYVFEFDADERWDKIILDQGFSKNVGSPPVRTRFLDSQGQPLQEPKLLDGAGDVLPNGDPEVYLEFAVYLTADFSLLNLDLSQALGM